jgi:putative intracellular protease/amidase
MTPKKPSQSAKRAVWLASLKPGDSVYLWRSWDGWLTAKVEAVSDYHRNVSKAEIRVIPDGHGTLREHLMEPA